MSLPEPARSRVLGEMADDLEAFYEHYRRRGMSEAEAAARAEEKVLADPDGLRRLLEVHTSGAQRWLYWLSSRLRGELDLFLLLAGVAPVLLGAGLLLASQLPRIGSGPFPWAVLALGVAVTGLALREGRRLASRSLPAPAEMRGGLSALLFLGWISPAVGALGFLVQLHLLAMRLSRGAASDATWTGAAGDLGRAASLLGASILVAMGAGILWLVLAGRLAALEQSESALLLDEVAD